jgi:Rrf2 family iron-sulfur cluster assembly transcriptional regulator
MHVPVQVDYGVRALVDLAQHSGESSVRASDIAQRQGIPEQYLARVLHSLKRHGLTKAQRGPTGGHSLALDPSEITMGAVMNYLSTPSYLVTCLDDAGNCEHSSGCGQRTVWQDVEAAMWQVLNGTTIADLVARMPALEREKVPA